MRLVIHLLALGLLLMPPGGTTLQQSDGATAINPCRVTVPNGIVAGGQSVQADSYGNEGLSTFGLWPAGTIVFRPGGPGFVTKDGSLGMKFGWWRGIAGQLRIEGRRLDARARPLKAEVSQGYGTIGFQPSYIIFPTPGCWEVTGRVGEASLTFVTKVVKIGGGPERRRTNPTQNS
jgi:hypothetical protein